MVSCSTLLFLLGMHLPQSEARYRPDAPMVTTLRRVLADIQRVQLTKDILSAEYDSLVAEVATIKVSRELGLFRRMKLKRLLRRSEDLSQQIAKLERVIHMHSAASQSRIKPAIVQLESQILAAVPRSSSVLPDSIRVRVAEWLWYRRSMIDFVLGSGGQRLGMSVSRLPVSGSEMEKANLAGDTADRLRRYERDLQFELDRIAFLLQLRAFFDRIERQASDPSWNLVRSWIDPGPVEARLALSGNTLRWRDNLSVRSYLLQVELQAARAAVKEWTFREAYWQEQFANREPDDRID